MTAPQITAALNAEFDRISAVIAGLNDLDVAHPEDLRSGQMIAANLTMAMIRPDKQLWRHALKSARGWRHTRADLFQCSLFPGR